MLLFNCVNYVFFLLCLYIGLWPPRSRGFLLTHNDAPQSVGLLWTSDLLVADSSTLQHTQRANIHAPVGFEPWRLAAVGLRLRTRGRQEMSYHIEM
jgi:hypothetical protein